MSRNEKQDRQHRDELDEAVAAVHAEPIDDRLVEQAAARVWARLKPAGAGGNDVCSGFRRQLPAYLSGELAPARALLLEDHTRECLPCRRALQEARQGSAAARPAMIAVGAVGAVGAAGMVGKASAARAPRSSATPWQRQRRWLAAAALVLLGLGLGLLWRRPWAAGAAMAQVEGVEGGLYRIAGATSLPVRTGEVIVEGERVRTAKGSHAVLRMADGSRIEMAERAGLALDAGGDGNTIDLERGRIIVQAAHQRPHHLYVATDDCLVAVTGTIFSVNQGTKGTRVSVVEGEVHVTRSRLERGAPGGVGGPVEAVLHPGGQITTSATVASVPVGEEVAWSQDAARYSSLLAALTAAGRDLDQQVARPAARTSSTIVDLVPAGTLFYAALPNLAANMAQTEQLFEQRLAENPQLEQWWNQLLGSPAAQANFHQLVQEVGDVGRYLGPEVVIAAGSSSAGAAGGGTGAASSAAPVLIAEAPQPAPLVATLRQEIDAFNQGQGKTVLVLLDQLPAAGQPAAAPKQLLVWVGEGLLVASPSAAQIVTVAANARGAQGGSSAPGAPSASANPFVASSFHARLTQAYADGAGMLLAADLKSLIAAHRSAAGAATSSQLAATGFSDLEDLVLERHDAAPAAGAAVPAGTETRAVVTFSQQRRGIASWLAAPAPMGSLGFFSADANLVTAFAVKSPVQLLDELLALSPQLAASLAKAEAEHGFSLRTDLAAPLGGEIAFGLDGPVLPSPSWQLVVEVYDPVRLQQTIAGAVQQANAELVAAGKPGLTLTRQESGGQTVYLLSASQPAVSVYYLYADGYLVAAPSLAQLTRALAQRAAGTSLASSAQLHGLLGRDGQVNVSALFYQNMGPLLSAASAPLAAVAGAEAPFAGAGPAGHGHRLSARGGSGLRNLLLGATHGPSLLYAYAEPDRIVFSGRSQAGPLGLNLETLSGFGAILGGIHEAQMSHAAAAAEHPRSGS